MADNSRAFLPRQGAALPGLTRPLQLVQPGL